MKNRMILASALLLAAGVAQAQDMYDLQRLSSSDLSGTSRYVGMGGAMGALGADLSAMGSNPAGLGLYRSSDISVTGGVSFLGNNTASSSSRGSFDQIGIAIASKYSNYSSLKYVNYGFNYRLRKNFFDNFGVNDNWAGDFSQTYQMSELTFGETDVNNMPGLAGAAVNAGVLGYDKETGKYEGIGATNTAYRLKQTGGIQEYDFSVAANWSDQFFLGATLGYYHANFDRFVAYTEYGTDDYSYDMYNYYRTRGDGVNFKLGGIIRPVADSNFRFGVAIETPTFYSLTDENGVDIDAYDSDNQGIGSGYYYVDPVDYQMHTPWKFNFSLGHTIGGKLALGAEYELDDYSSIRMREGDGVATDYTDYVDATCKNQLRTVHTLKLGAEFKPIPDVSFRVGYNYSTAAFDRGAYRSLYNFADMYIDTFTETSYENTLSSNRFTCGVGFKFGQFYTDLAFQYTTQKADFYAFDDYYTTTSGETVYLPSTDLKKDRSHLSLTLGYRF